MQCFTTVTRVTQSRLLLDMGAKSFGSSRMMFKVAQLADWVALSELLCFPLVDLSKTRDPDQEPQQNISALFSVRACVRACDVLLAHGPVPVEGVEGQSYAFE
eukprot:2888803-Amphidinium_carterae.1